MSTEIIGDGSDTNFVIQIQVGINPKISLLKMPLKFQEKNRMHVKLMTLNRNGNYYFKKVEDNNALKRL